MQAARVAVSSGAPLDQKLWTQVHARFAYFVLAHHRPEQLRLLVDTIADPRDLILLHVDLKSMLGVKPERNGTWPMARQLAREYRNVVLMRPRCTNWGGWSLSQVLLDAIDIALKRDLDWTHFINLSGQCLPIKPLDDIRSRIGASGDLAFVELRHFSSLPADDWHLKCHPIIELPHKAIKRRGPRRPPEDFELEHKGSQWCILPRRFCEWQRDAAIARRIRSYLRGLLLSDELLIQALVRNGPWRDRVAPHYGREIVWPGPKVMKMADWPWLQQSPAFYARKFDLQLDDALIPTLLRAITPPERAALALPAARAAAPNESVECASP